MILGKRLIRTAHTSAAAIVVASLTAFGSPGSAQTANAACGSDLPLSGKIAFDGQTVSVFVGARWGKGVLTLNDGQEIPFSAHGVQALESGVRVGKIEGEVYGLTDPLEFVGQYDGSSGGIVPIKSEGDITLVNSSCVVIVARHKSKGVTLSAPVQQSVKVQFR